ncbi:hypothetical protein H6F74_23630 [Trichocoleus sp. FACHB-90]|uniref:hypothetical protein n=1 Tax=Cyanophyceae TaxID=3028117 RepID=UPI00168698B6|nr:hypothetical protein [Trichocoleus sp. FACHB-90]MBD1929209.1 hypothetical protein [Trichocoleus sp. FACHB-90]
MQDLERRNQEVKAKLAEVRKNLAETKADRDDIFHRLDMAEQIIAAQNAELKEMRSANRKLGLETRSSQ